MCWSLGESISRGSFGIVRFAEATDPVFGLDGLENRSCVIKTVYLRRRFDAMLKEANQVGNMIVLLELIIYWILGLNRVKF